MNPADVVDWSPAADRLLSWREVRSLAGISRTTVWRLQNAGAFPRPVMISPGRVGWREREVADWKAALAPRSSGAPSRTRRVKPVATPDAADVARAGPPPASPAPTGTGTRSRPATPGQLSFDF